MYEFRNVQNRTMAAQAIPSYAPMQAMPHFNKLECFCFNEYTLQPGEAKQWPVVFVIDPKLPKDVRTITCRTPSSRSAARCRPSRPGAPASPAAALVTTRGTRSSGGLQRRRCAARARSCRRCRRSPGRSSACASRRDYEQDVSQLNPVHVDHRRRASRGAVRRCALVLLVNWVARQRRRRLSLDPEFENQDSQEKSTCRQRRHTGTRLTTSSPRRRASRCMAAFGLLLRHLRRRPVDQRPRLGRVVAAGRLRRLGASCCSSGSARPSARARAACTATASTSRSAGA